MMDRSQRAFLGSAALLFAGSAVVTMLWCGSMASMGGMEMPGDWTMSMAWMRMPGQSWAGAGGAFVGMWGVMTVAMMLPALVPMLTRYRRAVASTGEMRLFPLTMLVGLGYFAVWTALGVMIFPLGVALASVTMKVPALARAVPVASAVVVLVAGALQFSGWKARQLAYCRGVPGSAGVLGRDTARAGSLGCDMARTGLLGCDMARAGVRGCDVEPGGVPPGQDVCRVATLARDLILVSAPGTPEARPFGVPPPAVIGAAWCYGVRLGLRCTGCCAGLTAILLVMGVMDLRAMALVAGAITLERLAPAAQRVARLTGGVIVAAGLAWMTWAVGLV